MKEQLESTQFNNQMVEEQQKIINQLSDQLESERRKGAASNMAIFDNNVALNQKSGSLDPSKSLSKMTSERTQEQRVTQNEALSGQLGSSTANLESKDNLIIKDGQVAHVLPSSSSKDVIMKSSGRE